MSDRLDRLEEETAYLRKTVDEMSEVIARQDRTIDILTRRVEMLMERAAEAEAASGSSVPLADQKPPHW